MKLNTLSPPLGNIFGKTAGSVQGFLYYSPKCRSLGYRWSKQKLYKLLGNFPDITQMIQNSSWDWSQVWLSVDWKTLTREPHWSSTCVTWDSREDIRSNRIGSTERIHKNRRLAQIMFLYNFVNIKNHSFCIVLRKLLAWVNSSVFTFLSEFYKSAIIYRKAAMPRTLESISSEFMMVIESPPVWWYL